MLNRTLQGFLWHAWRTWNRKRALPSATLTSLHQVRAALVSNNLQALRTALEQQCDIAQAGKDLRCKRDLLRQELAAVTGTASESVTVQMLALCLPGERGDRLERCRQRLRQMATEVDQVNRGNATLVWHCLNFMQGLLVAITGGESTGGRYNAGGQRQEAACGSLIQMRG